MDSLTEALRSEAEAAAQFVTLLREEQKILETGRIAGLDDVVRQKSEVATQLETLAQLRNKLLAARGLPADREGVEAACAHPGADPNLADTWAGLRSQVLDAREVNRVNGELLKLLMQNNRSALDALNLTTGRSGLYGPDGQPRALGGGRIIDAV